MIDSIYYTSNLVPVPVEVVRKGDSMAIVRTRLNRLFEVPTHRVIPMYPDERKLPKDWIERSRPLGVLSISEYCTQNNLDIDPVRRQELARLCGHSCRRQGSIPWIGARTTRYFPVSVIDYSYRKMYEKNP